MQEVAGGEADCAGFFVAGSGMWDDGRGRNPKE